MQTLCGEVLRAIAAQRPRRVVATEPGAWRVAEDMRGWAEAIGIRADTRFLWRQCAGLVRDTRTMDPNSAAGRPVN
jgi:hypothetical protein